MAASVWSAGRFCAGIILENTNRSTHKTKRTDPFIQTPPKAKLSNNVHLIQIFITFVPRAPYIENCII
jgi:hypothetical protein